MQVPPLRHYLPVFEQGHLRQICLTEFCPSRPQETILCLPGLLETSTAWHEFVSFFARKHRVYVIDYAGRALSEYLPENLDYKMSACLADISSAISFIIGSNQTTKKTVSLSDPSSQEICLHLVGNSMGGLLAVTLAANEPSFITSLVINDVGPIVPWSGLVAIMGAIYVAGSRSEETHPPYSLASVARDLAVDPRLLRAVMRPAYADLDFRQGLQGLSYEKYFSKTTMPTLLVHSRNSTMVTPQVLEATKNYQHLSLLTVDGFVHPVSYSDSVNVEIERFISQENQADKNSLEDQEKHMSDWFERFKGKKFL